MSPEELSPVVRWMAGLDLRPVTHSRYVNGRLERWLRLGSNLRSITTNQDQLFKCEEPPPFIVELGDSLLPGWHSLLVCGGQTSIATHADHPHFERQAVMVNAGPAIFREHQRGGGELELADGAYLLDIGVPHSSQQLGRVRFHMTFRRVHVRFLGKVREAPP